MNFRKVSALASVAVLAFAACSNTGGGTPSPAASTGGGGGGSSPAASAGAGASGGALTPSTPAPAGDSSKGTVTCGCKGACARLQNTRRQTTTWTAVRYLCSSTFLSSSWLRAWG